MGPNLINYAQGGISKRLIDGKSQCNKLIGTGMIRSTGWDVEKWLLVAKESMVDDLPFSLIKKNDFN